MFIYKEHNVRKLFIFILLLLTARSFSQPLTARQIEADLQATYAKVLAYRTKEEIGSWDSVARYNEAFREKLAHYTTRVPATLAHPFDSLRKTHIDIVTSEDGLLRIYSWDTWLGGTMHHFENVFQFRAGGKVSSRAVYASDPHGAEYVPFYSQLFTLKANGKTYYLAVYNGIYSNRDASQSVRVFAIENGRLNDRVRLFKTGSGLVDAIEVPFDFFSVVDRPERPLRLIKYDPGQKLLYIPVVVEDGRVTDRFIVYRFTGTYFEKVQKKAGKP